MSGAEPGDRVHLIGIGGAGMSGIARILLARGVTVSGSDAKDSRVVLALRALGARVEVGHDAAHLPDAPATVVVSTAIRESNPELAAARARGLRVVHRADALAALTEGRRVAAVAGTHGKTSTSSMLTVALQHCGLDPSFAIGGDLASSGAGAHHGEGDVFVVEADESDGSFTAFAPDVAVVTNVEPDHLDHHGTEQAYRAVFEAFVGRIRPGGTLVTCADDPGSEELARFAEARGTTVRRYGRSATGGADVVLLDFRPDGPGARVVARHRGVELAVVLAVPGEHMALNALGALLAGTELGAPIDGLLAGLAAFDGVRRRFEFKGRAGGVAVYDDYAHHPTEVAAKLRAAREVSGAGLPGHRGGWSWPSSHTSTPAPGSSPSSSARRSRWPTRSSCWTCTAPARTRSRGSAVPSSPTPCRFPPDCVHFVPRWADVPAVLAGLARPGDLVLTMGAGDVTVLGPEVLLELERPR